MLSARTDDTIDRLVRRINIEEEPANRIEITDLMHRIRDIREQGFVFSKHTVIQGAGVIAKLLPIRRYGRILAIGVGAPVDRLEANEDMIVRELGDGIARFVDSDQ